MKGAKPSAVHGVIFGLVLSLLVTMAAAAHADYLRSEPGEGAVVSVPPERVDIWFTQDLFRRQGENWIRVFGPDEKPVHLEEAHIDDDQRSGMWVELEKSLSPGQYRVEWRTLSIDDGDDDEGEFTFTFDPQADVTSTPMLADPQTPSPLLAATVTTEPQVSPTVPPPTSTPEPQSAGGCSLGLVPAFALVGIVWIWKPSKHDRP